MTACLSLHRNHRRYANCRLYGVLIERRCETAETELRAFKGLLREAVTDLEEVKAAEVEVTVERNALREFVRARAAVHCVYVLVIHCADGARPDSSFDPLHHPAIASPQHLGRSALRSRTPRPDWSACDDVFIGGRDTWVAISKGRSSADKLGE